MTKADEIYKDLLEVVEKHLRPETKETIGHILAGLAGGVLQSNTPAPALVPVFKIAIAEPN